MSSDALKIAKLQARQHTLDAGMQIISNPIVELAALCFLLDYTDKHTNFTQLGQTVIFAAGAGCIAVQQLSKSPQLVQSIIEGSKTVAGAIPGIVTSALALGA